MTATPTHPAYNLLSRAHPSTTAQELFTNRIKKRPLILRPTSPPPASNDRQRRRLERLRKKEYFLRKQKPRPLSAKEKRISGVHDLSKEKGEYKWEVYVGLNRMWKGYVCEVLGLNGNAGGNRVVSAQNHGALLASLDFHGAELEVVRCGCVGRVGTRGIVVRDTKFTFVVVTRRDEVRSKSFHLSLGTDAVLLLLMEANWADMKLLCCAVAIPKKDTIFRFELPLPKDEENTTAQQESAQPTKKPLVFELHGSQFEMRAADRASKKFKWKIMDYI
jgi:ribonuclease P protein subunit POP4